MPSLKTPSGSIRFKSVALYFGVKQINKEIAAENLHILKEILDRRGVRFQLAFGTLLGAVREHDFISHDEDIDLAMLDEDRDSLLEALGELYEAGFRVCRFDRRDLLSLMRKGEYIDFYFYRPYADGLRSSSGWINLERHVAESIAITFKGEEYLVPADWEEYLVGEYGRDWRTPVKYNDYAMSPVKVVLFRLKERLKEILPDFLYFRLAAGPQRKMEEKSLSHLRRNLGLKI